MRADLTKELVYPANILEDVYKKNIFEVKIS